MAKFVDHILSLHILHSLYLRIWLRLCHCTCCALSSKGSKTILFSSGQVMLDTAGPELTVVNKSEKPISLEADATIILTPDEGQEASSEVFPINFDGLSKVQLVPFVFALPFPLQCVLETKECFQRK